MFQDEIGARMGHLPENDQIIVNMILEFIFRNYVERTKYRKELQKQRVHQGAALHLPSK